MLPLPLTLDILKCLTDLSSLHQILCTSPAAEFIFAEYYCEVVESIISNFIPGLANVMRTIAAMRSYPDRVRRQCQSVEAFNIFRNSKILARKAGTKPLRKQTTSLAAIRSLVATDSHVQKLRAMFFKEHLRRVNSIIPYDIHWKEEVSTRDQWAMMCRGSHTSELIPYSFSLCGESSWIEEQRVLRALWRIVVIFDLQKIAQPNSQQGSEMANALSIHVPERVWPQKYVRDFRMQELRCVLDFLDDPYDLNPTELYSLPRINKEPPSFPKPTPYFGTDRIADYWYETPASLSLRSPGYYNWCKEQRPSQYPSSLHGHDFKTWRKLGLGIWDMKKMARLGLINFPRPPCKRYKMGLHGTVPTDSEINIRWLSLKHNSRSF